jgi:hypothetical protein
MTPKEARTIIGSLGIKQHHFAELFGYSARSVRHWQRGDRPIPHGTGVLLRLLAEGNEGTIGIADVEAAAAPTANRSAQSAPQMMTQPAAPVPNGTVEDCATVAEPIVPDIGFTTADHEGVDAPARVGNGSAMMATGPTAAEQIVNLSAQGWAVWRSRGARVFVLRCAAPCRGELLRAPLLDRLLVTTRARFWGNS